MSKLSYIYNSNGNEIKIAVANCNSNTLLDSNNLPSNTLVITSPVEVSENLITDTGTQNMFITDYLGSPVRLTYHLSIENGIALSDNKDCIKLNINNTIVENTDKNLSLNINDLIDNKTINIVNDKLHVNTEALPLASQNTLGISKINNNTISVNSNGQININTNNLLLATNDSYGIVKPDNVTTECNMGTLSVKTKGLKHCDKLNYGTVLPDNKTISVTNGVISVNTDNLNKCSDKTFGIARPDNVSMCVNNGIYSVGSLEKATPLKYGTVLPDNKTIEQTNGVICVNDIDVIKNNINNIFSNINRFNTFARTGISDKKTAKIKTEELTINTFMCNQISSAVLNMPNYGSSEQDFPQQLISVQIIVNTNCGFYIDFIFDNNVSPEIYVKNIFYNNLEIDGIDYNKIKFASTNGKNLIMTIVFVCKNFASVQNVQTKITNITVTITNAQNINIKDNTLFSIVRFNSLYKSSTMSKPTIIQLTDKDNVINEVPIVATQNNKIKNKTV